MSDILELIQKINLNVSPQDFESIFYHSGCLQQNSYLRKKNDAYAQLGKYVITSAGAIFLYNNFKNFTVGQMSKGITTFTEFISNYFYEDYKLGDFVKNPPNVKENNIVVISKLAGFIYQQFNFIKIYEIFLPYLKKFNPLENKDYKSILQEYAQDRKEIPIYEILSAEGLEHEKIYNVQVKVGNKIAVGSAVGKKRATVEAAKNLIEKYKINYQSHALRENKSQNFLSKRPLTFKRKNLLTTAMSELKIESFAVNFSQMNEIFTHSSFLGERGYENAKSNECLSVLGANILGMLCYEYIIENYNLENIILAKTKSILIDEENLTKILPDSIANYLFAGRGHRQGVNEIFFKRIKVGIFKSVLAAMWLNYLETADVKILDCAKKFADKAFSLSAEEKFLDYTSFLQEVIQKFSFAREEKFVESGKSFDNMTTWKASLKINGNNFSINAESYGHDKSSARNLAAKEILPLLFPYCSNDLEIKEKFSRIMNPEEFFLFEMKKQEKIFSADEVNPKNNFEKILTEDEKSLKDEIYFDNAENILFIRKGIVFCSKNNHKISSVTGILSDLSGKTVKLNVNYCADCKIFFIDYAEFKYYRDIYGILLGNYLIQENFNPATGIYKNLSAESVLKICGYTVNQADNLTADQRHLILSNLMDKNIMSKPRIMRYLKFFINVSKNRDNMETANKKWQEDLIWVRNYNIDTQKHFFINSIEKF